MDMNQSIETRTPNGTRGQRSAARRWASSLLHLSVSLRAISSVKFPQFLVRNFYVKNSEFLRNFCGEITIWMLVHGYRIQGGKSPLAMDTLHGTSMSGHAMFVHVFCIGNSELGCTWFLKYKYILRNNPQNVKRGQRSAVRRWASGPSLTHTVFLSRASFSLHSLNGIPLCSQITVFVYILKTKRNRGTQGNEGGRWAPSDRRVRGGRPGQGGRCHPQISQFWSAIFT